MLLPEDLSPPPFTDDDLDAYFEFEERGCVDEDGNNLTVDLAGAPFDVLSWSITDTGSADWAMRKYAHIAARIEDVRLNAREFRRQIDEWERRETTPLEHRANFFFGHLTRFLQERREDPSDGRASIVLPSGDIVSRKVPERAEIADEKAFVEWARAWHPKAVKAKWSPVMKEVKALVQWAKTEDGVVPIVGDEVVPGVAHVAEHVNYDVKAQKPF
jgi:hypothetical protein